jgi:hypothetical protein
MRVADAVLRCVRGAAVGAVVTMGCAGAADTSPATLPLAKHPAAVLIPLQPPPAPALELATFVPTPATPAVLAEEQVDMRDEAAGRRKRETRFRSITTTTTTITIIGCGRG